MINPFIWDVQHTYILPASQNQNLGMVILHQQRKCNVDESRFPPIQFPVSVTALGKTNKPQIIPAFAYQYSFQLWTADYIGRIGILNFFQISAIHSY